MARGEPAKVRPQGTGVAIGAFFGALCLASMTLVATCGGSCGGCSPGAIWSPPPPSEPFAGALPALDELGWRDAARARPRYAAPPLPDAAAARDALARALEARGYVEVLAPDDASARALPFEHTVDVLDGACGVVAVLGTGHTTLLALDGPEGAVSAVDPSLAALAACGPAAIRATGTGSATIAAWTLPGLTPADARATGLPLDVLLAHAEAEALWRARGWTPSSEIVREAHGAGSHAYVTPPRVPASGCVAWIGVAIGAGRAETMASGTLVGRDYAPERALFGGASCAASTTSTSLTDEGTDGYVVYWRAWGTSGGGPSRPATATPLDARALRIVEPADVSLPAPFPAAREP